MRSVNDASADEGEVLLGMCGDSEIDGGAVSLCVVRLCHDRVKVESTQGVCQQSQEANPFSTPVSAPNLPLPMFICLRHQGQRPWPPYLCGKH